MQSRLLRILRIILFIGLAGSFLFFVPIQKIIDAVRGVSPFEFWISFLLGFPASYLSAIRLWMLTRRHNIQASVLKLFEINMVIRFYSFFSPASSIGSLMRWYKLSDNGKSAEALTAVAVNRLFDIFIVIAFGLFWLFGEANAAILVKPGWIFLFLFFIVLLWIFITRRGRSILVWMQGLTENSQWNWLKKRGEYLGRLSLAFQEYSRLEFHVILLMMAIGLLSELLGVLGYYYLAISIGLPVQLTSLGWMRSIFLLASFTPFTLVGGVGLREVSIVYILTTIGVHADIAAAFSFLVYVRSVLTSLVGGLIEFLSLPKFSR